MVAIVTILAAFPLGYFVRSRLAASTAYAVAYLWAFVFQTLYLVLDVINDSGKPAFEPQEFPWAYGVVTCRSSWPASGSSHSATTSAAAGRLGTPDR